MNEPDDEMIRVTDRLDLHGTPIECVPEMVEAFLKNAKELGLTDLKIIHGKGRSRMKHTVINLLREHPEVAEYGDAPPYSGGWGATFVKLHYAAEEHDNG